MRIDGMEPNSKGQFSNISPGAIFRSLDDGCYYMRTSDRIINGATHNVMCVDASTTGNRAYIRPTEEVCYLGHLGLNWHPDEF